MFKDMKELVMAQLMSSLEDIHCSRCDGFVGFKIAERRHEKHRVFAFVNFKFVRFVLAFECVECSSVCAQFRGSEIPRLSFSSKT